LIEAKPRAGLPIGHYAAVLGVSESRLTSHCRRVTGRSPLQIINGCIVRRAREKMLATKLSTSEIAFSLGFRDPAYFSRFFRLQTGQTPTEFRTSAGPAAGARPNVTACADRR
jgi:AraC family transcriptional activator of pobA